MNGQIKLPMDHATVLLIIDRLLILQAERFAARDRTDKSELASYYGELGTGIGTAIQQIRFMQDGLNETGTKQRSEWT